MEKFATYERDHTGLDYADQRYFTDTSGRFVTPDPARDGMNWYAYVGGDPVNKNDPTGLEGEFLACDNAGISFASCVQMLASVGINSDANPMVGGCNACGGGASVLVFANDLSYGGITGINFQGGLETFDAIRSQPGYGCGGIVLPAGSTGNCGGGTSGTAVSSGMAGDAASFTTTFTLFSGSGGGFWNGVQLGLDVIGLIPVVGEAADVVSGGISIARGDWVGAGLSFASVIPFAGDATGVAKIARRFNSDQQVIVDLAREAGRRGGLTRGEAETLIDWANEYGLRGRNVIDGPHLPRTGQPGSSIDFDHAHIGPINHIRILP